MNKRAWLYGVLAIPWADIAIAGEQVWPVPPGDLEQIIWQHLQANAGLSFTSIDRVKCSVSTCEFAFTGPDINATRADFDAVVVSLLRELAGKSIPVRQGRSAREEVAPGVSGIVVTLSSIAPAQEPGHKSPPVNSEKG